MKEEAAVHAGNSPKQKPYLLNGPDHKALDRKAATLSAMAEHLAAHPEGLANLDDARAVLRAGGFHWIDITMLAEQAHRMAFERIVVSKAMSDS